MSKLTAEQIKEQLSQINEFMVCMKNTNIKFGELEVYTGGKEAINKIGSIAACIYQPSGKPIIFLANSTITRKFELNKQEVNAILYHEHAHYSLGHIKLDFSDAQTFEEYVAQESQTDLYAVELAHRNGIDKDKFAFTMASALGKMAASVVYNALAKKEKPNMQALESLDIRVEALKPLFSTTKYEEEMQEFFKAVAGKVTRIIQKVYGATTTEEINEIYMQLEVQ